jgi:hypothetical protein
MAHTTASLLIGTGDPCRLLGFTVAQIKDALANGVLPDNKKYRTPTFAENQAVINLGYSSWQQPAGALYGRYFGPSSGSNPANRQFYPGNDRRYFYNGGWSWGVIGMQTGYGWYWSSDICSTHHQAHAFNFDHSSTSSWQYSTHNNPGQESACGVRCVAQP